MSQTAESWTDDRALPDPFSHGDDRHAYRSTPPLVPANDNSPTAWIQRDAEGRPIQVVRAARKNPLMCRPYRARPAIPSTMRPEDRQRVVRALLRQALAANDSDIIPRAPRNSGAHADMEPWLGALAWWRLVATDTPRDPLSAAHHADVADTSNSIRPTIAEIIDRLPEPVSAQMKAGSETGKAVKANAVWRNGRIAQLGGLKFATGAARLQDGANIAANDNRAVSAGSLTAYQRSTGKWSKPAEVTAERGPVDTTAPVDSIYREKLSTAALPRAPKRLADLFIGFPRIGVRSSDVDGEMNGTGVRGSVPFTEGDDSEMATVFRRLAPHHAAALDAAMTVRNMTDVAAAAGKTSAAAGRRALIAACAALEKFRRAENADR